MKKTLTFIAFGLAVLLGTVSCGKDKNESDQLRRDDLATLIKNFCIIREDADSQTSTAFITRGRRLNEADPTELSIRAEDYDAAAAIFEGMIPEGADVTKDATSITWHLKKGDQSQGDAVFKKESAEGRVATLSLPSGSVFVRKVCFLTSSAWPENVNWDQEELLDDFYFGKVIDVKKDMSKSPGSIYCKGDCGTGKFIVMKEYVSNGDQAGVLLRLDPDKIYRGHSRYKWASEIAMIDSEMKELYEIYKKRKNVLEPVMSSCGFGPRNAKYLILGDLFNWSNGEIIDDVSGDFYVGLRYYFQFCYIKMTYDWRTGSISDIECFDANDFIVLQGDMVSIIND